MAGINLIKYLKALISVRVPLETLFDSKSNYSNSSGNNNDNDTE